MSLSVPSLTRPTAQNSTNVLSLSISLSVLLQLLYHHCELSGHTKMMSLRGGSLRVATHLLQLLLLLMSTG